MYFNILIVTTLFIKINAMAINEMESDVGFPEIELPDFDRTNTRVPLYIPGKCPQNQLLFPGNQASDWVCDCAPGTVYYSPKQTCYPVYRQGPCADKEYLILPKDDFAPQCVKNPCEKDGNVKFDNKCYQLYKSGGPCAPEEEVGGIFGINSTTLLPECLKGTDRLSFNYDNGCPMGSRRQQSEHCSFKLTNIQKKV